MDDLDHVQGKACHRLTPGLDFSIPQNISKEFESADIVKFEMGGYVAFRPLSSNHLKAEEIFWVENIADNPEHQYRINTPEHIEALFDGQAADINIHTRYFNFHYGSVESWLENFKTIYGPVKNAFAALDEAGQAALREDFLTLLNELNVGRDGTMKVPGEYLEIVITRA